jgi:DNA polymerase I
MNPADKFFLIDGHSYSFQAFYAIGSLQTPSGVPVGAVYVFAGLIEKVLAEGATHLAVAFDTGAATFRAERYPEYKVGRLPCPEGMRDQVNWIKEVLEAYRIRIVEVPGYEADDAIAAIALRASKAGIPTYIISKDKDLEQLIDDRIRIYDPKDGKCLDAAGLLAKKGIRPDQVVDFLALVGDASDNVPGVDGIGSKTAVKILQAAGSFDAAFRDGPIPEISAKVQEKLRSGRESAELSRALVTLDASCPIPGGAEPEGFRLREPDREKIVALYRRFQFTRLLTKYQEGGSPAGGPVEKELFPADVLSPPRRGPEGARPAGENPDAAPCVQESPLPSTYSLIETGDDLAALVRRLSSSQEIAVSVAAMGFDPMGGDGLAGISFACPKAIGKGEDRGKEPREAPVEAWYVPLRGPETLEVRPEEAIAALRPILESASIAKVGQNIKFTLLFLLGAGIRMGGIRFDTMIASYLLNPEVRAHNLGNLSAEYLGHQKRAIEDLIGTGKERIPVDRVPTGEMRDFSCEEADAALRLALTLEGKLREAGLEPLFRDVEMPLIEVLADMERAGIAIDPARLAEMAGEIRAALGGLTAEIHRLAGRDFNIASPPQLAEVLYGQLGLPAGKKGKSGTPTTAAEALEEIRDRHPIVGKIIEHQELTKLLGTYVEALPTLVKPATGKIHTSFNQTVAATGRLSSSDPNLQNIPIKTELGRRIRKAFIPSGPDKVLLSADYSQVELRILAHLSEDAALIEAFEKGDDIHRIVAAQLNGVKPEDVTPAMRRFAKVVNFGIVYGMTPFGLSQDLGIGVEDAGEIIRTYFDAHPGVRAFVDRAIAEARAKGCVRTILGRRRPIRDIESRNPRLRAFAERTAVNSIVQGSAADMIKVAMNNIHTDLVGSGSKAKLILQIHDELVLEVPRGDLAVEEARVREEMVGAMTLRVPVIVNISAGNTWYDAKE